MEKFLFQGLENIVESSFPLFPSDPEGFVLCFFLQQSEVVKKNIESLAFKSLLTEIPV